ncbi:hypothetical protein [Sphingobacterium gobiense]|uniref:Uncharacterized protein n=1 Tax=Sphingobacterium gobiense TaxID=1382456 RepID=A0A2S9JUD8_9SPHI|nr:hypothetical protein [Sphingobacterium gobiense]PRD56751.1 hypothetical protein C5749_05850 [Sphingobacterium gobiense]
MNDQFINELKDLLLLNQGISAINLLKEYRNIIKTHPDYLDDQSSDDIYYMERQKKLSYDEVSDNILSSISALEKGYFGNKN